MQLTDRVEVSCTVSVNDAKLEILGFLEEELEVLGCLKIRVQIVLNLLCLANLNPRALLGLLEDKTLGIGLGQDVFVFELSAGNVQIHIHGERVCVVYHLSVTKI